MRSLYRTVVVKQELKKVKVWSLLMQLTPGRSSTFFFFFLVQYISFLYCHSQRWQRLKPNSYSLKLFHPFCFENAWHVLQPRAEKNTCLDNCIVLYKMDEPLEVCHYWFTLQLPWGWRAATWLPVCTRGLRSHTGHTSSNLFLVWSKFKAPHLLLWDFLPTLNEYFDRIEEYFSVYFLSCSDLCNTSVSKKVQFLLH